MGFLLFTAPAHADPKFMGIIWYGDHWENQDFIPYYDNGTEPHNNQWDDKTWTPANWVEMSGKTGPEFIHHLQVIDILGSNGVEDGAPYINVGPNFYHLSGYDKRRVAATLDYVYNVTAKTPKMFYLRDAKTEKFIGYYTKDGLTLE